MILLVAVLALLCSSCVTETPPAEVEEACPCPLTSDQVITCSDDSVVTFWNGTDFIPCECMSAEYYPPGEEPDQICLPDEANVITAIDITPDNVDIDVHDGRLDFRLPGNHGYLGGHQLTVWQHDATETCDPAADLTNWSPEPGTASVIIGPPDIARTDHLRHTSIFALIEMRGEISMLGVLVEPFAQENGDIVTSIEVLVSSTNPELQGTVVKVRLVGIEGDPARLIDILDKIPVGSVLALQLDADNLLSIWWEDSIVQFYIQELVFE
jgi:hypothetical protein